MPIHDWPRAERPREKLLERGAYTLSDAELLAVLLGTGTRSGYSALELARALLKDFGSLRDLLTSDPRRALRQHGIGLARYALLQAALELTRRHYRESLRLGSVLAEPDATQAFLTAQLRDRPYEVFCCLHLDTHRRLIAFEEMFRGTVDCTQVHPREVARETLLRNTSAVILAHNHPSGEIEPSHADQLMTRRIQEALALMEVQVLDHIIVGNGRCYSFAQHGLL